LPAGALDLAIAAARDAGTLLRDRLGRQRSIEFKGLVDLVTDADRAAETLIAGRVRDAFPDHRILGEEGARGTAEAEASQYGERAPYGWLIDPLDGTTNYAHAYPHFAVSIALERDAIVQLGVVYDPMLDELFVAERGRGATVNGQPLHVSDTDELILALIATGFPYDIAQRGETIAIWNAFLNRCQGTRRDGSAALDLCYVAAGRLDGFWERPLAPWDIGAGSLLVEEAGGRVSGYENVSFDPYRREVVASNGSLHEAMLTVMADHLDLAASV
jgi:myo-inositol-1(or 4)-monophosphatase